MLNKVGTIERETPKHIKLFGSRQIPGLVTSGEFCQISLTTGHSRSEHPGGGALKVCDNGSGNLLEGRGESMLCSATDFERNCQAAKFQKIEQRAEGLNILQALSSEYDLKRKHHLMSRQNSPQEENFCSKRRRFNAEGRQQNLGFDEAENVAVADQSDSTMKGSDLTAERLAEGSSRTTSSSENNGKLDPPPTAATNLSSLLREKLKGTCSDSGLQENFRTRIEDGQTVLRSEGFCSSSRPVSGKDEDWLSLGLDSGYRSHDQKHSSNKLSLEVSNNLKGSIIRWNKDKDTEEQRRQQQQQTQMLNSAHAGNKLTTLLQPSYPIQPQQLSFYNTRADITNYSNAARPLLQTPAMAANRISFQKNITDSTNFSALNVLQTIEDQQNTAVFPSVDQNFLYQRQGFYDRIPGRTDLCFADPRMVSYRGNQRFTQGLRSLIAGTSDAYRNSETDGLLCAGFSEAGVLQKDIVEKMQYRTQWNTRDSLSPWYKPENSLGSLIRPNASEIASRRFSTDDRTLPFRHQQYERQTLPAERSFADPAQRFSGASWTENVRIFKPSRAAQAGLWFVLQASNNQNGDGMLPQIPRNYLRIKDGTMTILVVKKYLMKKLGLNSESEIEIMCKGQKLLPSQTVQNVRDVMWASTLNEEDISRIVASDPSSTDHLMVLDYQLNNLNPADHAQF